MDVDMPQGPQMLNALATIATSVGLSSALILFFVWWSFKREEKLTKRLETLEDFSRTTLIELTKETTEALVKDALATQACVKAIETNTQVISGSVETSKEVKSLLVDHHNLTMKIADRVDVNKS